MTLKGLLNDSIRTSAIMNTESRQDTRRSKPFGSDEGNVNMRDISPDGKRASAIESIPTIENHRKQSKETKKSKNGLLAKAPMQLNFDGDEEDKNDGLTPSQRQEEQEASYIGAIFKNVMPSSVAAWAGVEDENESESLKQKNSIGNNLNFAALGRPSESVKDKVKKRKSEKQKKTQPEVVDTKTAMTINTD